MDSDDRRDFELLTRQLVSNSSRPSSASTTATSTSSLHSSGFSINETWPLYVTTKFVDHYICGDLVGTGSYAEVRECIDTNTLQRCAMKVINKDYLRRQAPRALSNQLQEIRLLRHLRHPNIITMRECLFKGNKIYLILEYCSFVLSELLDTNSENDNNVYNKLTLPLARHFFNQLCVGLRYLHSLGVIHRDIKPQNLLLTNCGNLKIIDFGVSHVLSIWSRTDVCSNYEGSPLFQAPEVVCGQADYAGFKVDVWSAGVTLYLMLYGRYPFFDEALLGLYDKILAQDLEIPPPGTGEPPVLSQLALTDLLAMLLEKEASKRASIEQVLQHPWLKLHSNIDGRGLDDDDELDEQLHEQFMGVISSKRPRPSDSEDIGDSAAVAAVAAVAAQPHVYERDIYRSISVLPYLYKHHFPNSNIVKVKVQTTANGIDSPSGSAASSRRSSPAESPNEHHDNHLTDERVEWGTREQYQLMKVPPVRANRLPGNLSTGGGRRRSRRRQRRGRPGAGLSGSTSVRRHYRRGPGQQQINKDSGAGGNANR